MLRALNTAATGMSAQEQQVNAVSNNIANANTTGYKAQRTEFEDLLYETVEEAGGRSSGDSEYTVGHQVGAGARVTATRKMLQMGSPQVTERPYDLMIMGDGYFGVQTGKEMLFTRDGSFTVDAQGVLKTRAGHSLVPNITVPPNTKHLNVSPEGKVQAFLTNGGKPVELGQIPVFTFINPAGLSEVGGNLARRTPASGDPVENIPGADSAGALQQGALESSNVSVMNEMTNLIKAQRAYELNSKVMGVADQMLSTISHMK